MIAKKSKKANLEKKRFGLFLLGMVSASAFALAAFEWKEVVSVNEQETLAQKEKVVDINDIPIDYVIMPKPQPARPKPQVERSNTFQQVENITEPTDNVEIKNDKIEDVVIDDGKIDFGSGTGEGPTVIIEDRPLEWVKNMPEFPGGEKQLYNFLGKHLKYPDIAQEIGLEGKIYVQFVVEKDGSITNVNVINDIGGGCGKEAARVVKLMPKWSPGMQNGRKVRVRYTLPFNFELD